MALGYAVPRDANFKHPRKDSPLQYYFIVDLPSLDMKPIEVPLESILLQCVQE